MKLKEVVLGGPGAGKTTELLRLVRELLDRGVEPERIAFVAFTNAAADEAKSRAAAELGVDVKRLKWFRTIHSLAFEQLGLRREEVLTKKQWAELGGMLELTFGKGWDLTEGLGSHLDDEGDRLRWLCQLAAASGKGLPLIYYNYGAGITWPRLEQFHRSLQQFKLDLGVVDFDDMLELYAKSGHEVPVDYAFIDEGQDLSHAQWRAVRVAFRSAEVTVGGDDRQAIYAWAGADVEAFLALGQEAPVRSLPKSYRLGAKSRQLAQGVIERVSQRYPQEWSAGDHADEIFHFTDARDVPLQETPGTWLLLARNGYLLHHLAQACREQGLPYLHRGESSVKPKTVEAIRAWTTLKQGRPIAAKYWPALRDHLELRDQFEPEEEITCHWFALRHGAHHFDLEWHDAFTALTAEEREYYRSCLRRGEDLLQPPRVRLSTIHGAKGQEADSVLLLPDVSGRTWNGYQRYPDDEHRVLYVGLTRQRRRLWLGYPRTSKAYEL